MLLATLAHLALGAPNLRPCQASEEILKTASVRSLPTAPSPLGLAIKTPDLTITEADQVSWPLCAVTIRMVFGGWGVTETGLPVYPSDGRLITRDDTVPKAEVEPPHPDLAGGKFLGSTPLAEGQKRAGLWRQPGGDYLVAWYTLGETTAPHPLFLSSLPIIGIFYLGAPDTFGGQFSFWQSLEDGSYRFVSGSWGEAGLR